ncbi:MAG: ABC transporter permease [Lachnospiraceae bacterium]|nr:ABC transporter permease [Lachnospiraceae bacterium]
MMNYMKSELYRIWRSKGIYLLIGGCMILMLAMNLVLWAFGKSYDFFTYATTKFSFSMLETGMQTAFFITLMISCMIFGDEYKHRTFSNVTAFGYSKMTVFFSKWMITLFVSAIGLVLVVGTLLGSGWLLLEHSNVGEIEGVLKAVVVCIPIFICGVTGAYVFIFLLKNETKVIWTWLGVFIGVAMPISLLGMKFKFLEHLSKWLVFDILGDVTIDEAAGDWYMIWETSEGLTRTILAGVLGTIVFLVIGMIGMRKKK